MFGMGELVIASDSNINCNSFCHAKYPSFNLPEAQGRSYPSMNGGEKNFKLKQFEVYKVSVRSTFIINLGTMNGGRKSQRLN
jgi:hypothetical protein